MSRIVIVHKYTDTYVQYSGEASPTIWSCYANISVFIDRENNPFLKKLIMIMI